MELTFNRRTHTIRKRDIIRLWDTGEAYNASQTYLVGWDKEYYKIKKTDFQYMLENDMLERVHDSAYRFMGIRSTHEKLEDVIRYSPYKTTGIRFICESNIENKSFKTQFIVGVFTYILEYENSKIRIDSIFSLELEGNDERHDLKLNYLNALAETYSKIDDYYKDIKSIMDQLEEKNDEI